MKETFTNQSLVLMLSPMLAPLLLLTLSLPTYLHILKFLGKIDCLLRNN